ncbi:DUF397 domain-containing protein [Streptomyces sp. WELS2]|nr:DUF397 domain-containing protein [Streptomyces sp. WELS2]
MGHGSVNARTRGCGRPVPVRDSKVPAGSALIFGTASWSAFVASVKESL